MPSPLESVPAGEEHHQSHCHSSFYLSVRTQNSGSRRCDVSWSRSSHGLSWLKHASSLSTDGSIAPSRCPAFVTLYVDSTDRSALPEAHTGSCVSSRPSDARPRLRISRSVKSAAPATAAAAPIGMKPNSPSISGMGLKNMAVVAATAMASRHWNNDPSSPLFLPAPQKH